jgi:hypothetical protein
MFVVIVNLAIQWMVHQIKSFNRRQHSFSKDTDAACR